MPASRLESMCVFARGVRPEWEDPANCAGGEWLATLGTLSEEQATHAGCDARLVLQNPFPWRWWTSCGRPWCWGLLVDGSTKVLTG